MYLPKSFEPPDIDALQQFVRTHPFGVLVTMTRGGLEGNHIPFLIDAQPAPYGTLRGHVARANPIWQEVQLWTDALVIFQGPDSFISPSWYPSKLETATGAGARVVPTWNYVVVHAHGHLRVIQDSHWLRAHVEALTNRHEQDREAPWAVTDAPADYIQKMVGAIVGLEIQVARLTGKWKLGQNRTEQDRAGVVDGLRREGTESAEAMAALVRGTLEGP
jgi:transcriptional regulator